MMLTSYHRLGPSAALWPVVALGLIVAGSLCCAPSVAKAQESTPSDTVGAPQSWRELPVDEELRKTIRIQVSRMLLAGKFANQQEREVFDRYYKQYALARWSRAEDRNKLTDYRKEHRNNLRTAGTGSRPADVHDYLNTLTLDFMSKLAAGDGFHPAARVNAMLMVGELSEKEAASSSDIPEVLPAALPELVKAVESPEQIDSVKVAAMVGILRHARLDGVKSQAAQGAVAKAVLPLVQAKAVPAGRSLQGHAWMRSQAAEILGEIGQASPTIVEALAGQVGEKNTPFFARCAAAEALGNLSYSGVGNLDARKLAVPLAQFTVDACEAEAEKLHRGRLNARLLSAELGMKGAAQVSTNADAARALDTILRRMLEYFEDRNLSDDELMSKIGKDRAIIEQALGRMSAG